MQFSIDMEEANEENSLKYFEGMDAFVTCFGTTRANAGSNVRIYYMSLDAVGKKFSFDENGAIN